MRRQLTRPCGGAEPEGWCRSLRQSFFPCCRAYTPVETWRRRVLWTRECPYRLRPGPGTQRWLRETTNAQLEANKLSGRAGRHVGSQANRHICTHSRTPGHTHGRPQFARTRNVVMSAWYVRRICAVIQIFYMKNQFKWLSKLETSCECAI